MTCLRSLASLAFVLQVAAADPASRWSDPATWPGGVVPGLGDDVTIPAGARVLFDTASAEIGALTVMGELIFEDDEPISLVARRILVTGPGSALRAGSEAEPFTHKLDIVLTEPIGDPATQPMMGYRVLGTRNGATLALHGASTRKLTWTQLAADATPGQTNLTLITAPGWAPGDNLAIAASGEDPREAERLTVTAVSNDGLTIAFEPPLAHTHLGRVFTYAGKPVDMRAEVALLSRNITVRNAQDDPDDKMGFHGMFMPDSARVTLEGVEFIGGGQIARPGRYPIHWHRNEALETVYGNQGWQREAVDRAGDWIRNCSIHSSGQRGIVTHGVDNVLVASNVVFDVWDTAYIFSEDGLEKGNVFVGNLAMLVKRKSRFNPVEFAFPRDDHTESDQSEHRPAGFWGRNPFNPLIDNHSAGTIEGIGFFIDSQVLSHDMSRLIQRDQSRTHSVVFRGNLSHSNYREGVAGGGIPTYGPKTRGHGLMIGDYDAAFDARFEDFQTYKNSVLGVWIEDDRHTLTDSILTDSSGGLIAFRSNIVDVVFNQRSDNTLGREPQTLGNRRAPAGGIHLQSTGYGNHPHLERVTFINTTPAAVTVWQDPLSSTPTATLRDITLINTQGILQHAQPDEVDGRFIDLDGSLTGTGTRTTIGGTSLATQGASFDPGFNAYLLPDGCNPADLFEPFSALDANDILTFAALFNANDPAADFSPDAMFDINDILFFANAFNAGCP